MPPSDKIELHQAAQPALSGPPEVFGNERLQALFAAVDQVSRSTASASQTASLTESEGKPMSQLRAIRSLHSSSLLLMGVVTLLASPGWLNTKVL